MQILQELKGVLCFFIKIVNDKTKFINANSKYAKIHGI
jgi:hypothetical protein